MGVLHVWPQAPERREEKIIVSSVLEIPGEDRKTLWYSIPEYQEPNLAQNSDPFVIGAIYLIMQSGHDAHIHGFVSPSLLCNLEDFQSVWTNWRPGLKRVVIHADHEKEPVDLRQKDESVVAFSGGVDSCFTAFSQAGGYRDNVHQNPSRLAAGVMVQGFDIPLDQPEVFASAVTQSQVLLSSIGLELIPIATNYRELVEDWTHSFGAAAASCLALFSGRFRAGFISQGLTWSEFHFLHEGSNPLTDPLLSSDSFRIVPGGTAFKRSEKIYAMREWKEFLQYLRVCWQGPQKDRNCCECEKCMRNILTFRALGLGLPPCFSKDVDDRLIETIGLGAGHLPEIRYEGLASLARANNVQGNWGNILKKRLADIRHFQQTKDSKIWRVYRGVRRRANRVAALLRSTTL